MPVEVEAVEVVSSVQMVALAISMASLIGSMSAIWLSVKASQRVRHAEWVRREARRVWQSPHSADLPG